MKKDSIIAFTVAILVAIPLLYLIYIVDTKIINDTTTTTVVTIEDDAKIQSVVKAEIDDAGNLSVKTTARTVDIKSENNEMKNFVMPAKGDDIIFKNIGETHDPEYVLVGILKQ